MELTYLGAAELARRLRSRDLRSRDLLEALLARADALNPALNAIVSFDRARAAADAADAELDRGHVAGSLHGDPMTIKDTFETAGLRTTAGAEAHANHVPATDAVAVARLEAAGAIVFGKTDLSGFAMDTQSYNVRAEAPRTAWRPGAAQDNRACDCPARRQGAKPRGVASRARGWTAFATSHGTRSHPGQQTRRGRAEKQPRVQPVEAE